MSKVSCDNHMTITLKELYTNDIIQTIYFNPKQYIHILYVYQSHQNVI